MGAVGLTALCRRIGAPYPPLLALSGAALAFAPSGPEIHIEPELALTLFLAPVLLEAAYHTSPRDLWRNFVPLTSLALVAVLLTAAVVAFIGWRMGGLPVAAAAALGAVVSPPDSAAATASLSPLRLPRRIRHLLSGESLLNDATALILYRISVRLAVGHAALGEVGHVPLVIMLGSPLAGFALAQAQAMLTGRVRDAPSFTVLGLVGVFGVWLLAERMGLSPLVTVVVYGLTLGRVLPTRVSARNRVSSASVAETLGFVLTVLAIVIMGLQARQIVERFSRAELGHAVQLAVTVLAAVVLVRLGYVMAYNTAVRLKNRWLGVKLPPGMGAPTAKSGLVISWCGMRGMVTLAGAFALPEGFPGRDLIVFCAFFVVLGTLTLQGFTLKALVKALRLRPDTSVEQEVAAGRSAMLQAALERLASETSPAIGAVREHYEAAQAVTRHGETAQEATEHDRLRLLALTAERREIERLRKAAEIGEEAFHRLEAELDWAELDAAPAGYFQPLRSEGDV